MRYFLITTIINNTTLKKRCFLIYTNVSQSIMKINIILSESPIILKNIPLLLDTPEKYIC